MLSNPVPVIICRMRSLLIVCCCCLAASLVASEQDQIQTFDRLVDAAYQPGADDSTYRKPSPATMLAWEQLFSHLLAKAAVPGSKLFPEQQQRAADIGYQLETLATDEGTFWLLRETTISGGGFFAIRCGAASPLFIQAPHMRNDKHSERLATRAFLASEARALAISTISREAVKPPTGKRYGPADMSHQEQSLFTSATRAAARTLATMQVIQFHGYGSEGRGLGPRTMILSNGTRRPDTGQLAFAQDIRQRWQPIDILIYPDDISVLGALLNAQGGVLMRYPQHQFLHLEMSLQLRQELLAGDLSRFDMRPALAQAATTP